MGPLQVVRQANGHTVGVQKDPEAPIVFIHVDDLKKCPPPGRSNTPPSSSDIHLKLDQPIDLTGHILSPFLLGKKTTKAADFI